MSQQAAEWVSPDANQNLYDPPLAPAMVRRDKSQSLVSNRPTVRVVTRSTRGANGGMSAAAAGGAATLDTEESEDVMLMVVGVGLMATMFALLATMVMARGGF